MQPISIGKQGTITWRDDHLKISHIEKVVVERYQQAQQKNEKKVL